MKIKSCLLQTEINNFLKQQQKRRTPTFHASWKQNRLEPEPTGAILLDSSGTRVRCTSFGTAVTSGIRVHSPLAFFTTYTLTIDRVLSASLTRRVSFPYRASLIPTPRCTFRLMCTGFG